MNTAANAEQQEGLIICAWCQKVMGTKPGIAGASHSICPPCKDKHFPRIDSRKEEEAGARMNILCFDGDKLVAIEAADHLTNKELKASLDHQRDMGRTTAIELIY